MGEATEATAASTADGRLQLQVNDKTRMFRIKSADRGIPPQAKD